MKKLSGDRCGGEAYELANLREGHEPLCEQVLTGICDCGKGKKQKN